ncbi:hypothetical protein [Mesorhizobium sp. B2-3-15]|uniref:hypothetical protein n=1 Tax=Mesorhizobium sp. B2-3-15 TaxID=2589949 RepID=UPI001AED71BB|nr:hypothetical protein [Mesorhizobium sp. B2-3-15]
MKNMFRKCCACSHQGKPESTAGADCAMPGWFWMKAVTLESSRKLCAKAISAEQRGDADRQRP